MRDEPYYDDGPDYDDRFDPVDGLTDAEVRAELDALTHGRMYTCDPVGDRMRAQDDRRGGELRAAIDEYVHDHETCAVCREEREWADEFYDDGEDRERFLVYQRGPDDR